MNLSLFVEQVNTHLQNVAKCDNLENVCDLLRAHIGANICLRDREGRIVVEILAENDGGKPVSFTVGGITITRYSIFKDVFSDDEKLATNIALAVCTVLLGQREGQLSAENKRRAQAVRAIINSLSFTELEAATHAVKTLGETNEGIIKGGHIADKLGFARSVVTAALRKLEGADLIETRSLGMKGTYIRVKDSLLAEELAKL